MRTRKEIEKAQLMNWPLDEISFEVLLDIRELLMNPPIEISGTPVSEKEGNIRVESYSTSEPIPIMEPLKFPKWED